MFVGLVVLWRGRKEKASKLICLEAFVSFSFLRGEPAGTRTQGPYIKSVLLYQLSYEFIA